MIERKIYLAGPISGVSWDTATEWRRDFSKKLQRISPVLHAASPLRKKEYLSGRESIATFVEESLSPLSTARGIMTRDHWDCMDSHLIVANLLGTQRVSIGTVMEIAWAHAYRKPLILVMEKTGNPHDHPMITEATGFRVDNLDDAVHLCGAILLG